MCVVSQHGDGKVVLSVMVERRNIDSLLETRSGTQLFIVIVVVVLNVHDTFAGPFKRTTTPSANTFVYSLIHMSNAHIGNDRGWTYCKEGTDTYDNDDPAYLLNSIATSPASATASHSEVGEWAGHKNFEKAKYTHACKPFGKMLVPGRTLVVIIVIVVA
jgi:hypothetical protein